MREAWLDLPSEEEVRARGDRSVYDFGRIPAMSKLIDAHPRIGPRFGELYLEIMFREGALTRSEREMVAAVASAAQECFY
ncbi:MAG: hypothetical protein ACE5MI_10495 [Acidimicrobiia bacterium]